MANNVEQQILNVSKSIDTLTSKITKLQEKMNSGDYGTGQLRQMQRQIDQLNTSLETKKTTQFKLISEKDVQAANKAIESTRRQLEYLRTESKSRASGKAPFLDYSPEQLEKEITKYERTLKSFQTRLQNLKISKKYGVPLNNTPIDDIAEKLRPASIKNRLQKQGIEPLDEAPKGGDRAAVERRINQRTLGLALTNDELKAKIAESRKIAADILYGRPGTGENGVPVSRNEILGGFQPGDKPYTVPPQNQASIENEVKLTEKQIAAKKKLEEEEKKLADLRHKIATDPAYKQYMEQLRARNLDENDIQSALNRGGSITQVTAARNMGGVNNKFQSYVNEKTGTSTPALSSQFRSFGSDIARDIGQFAKWSIAVAAVYTPLQKLGELMSIMVDNESRLADATIAANVPFSKAGAIFDQVAVSANAAGESINTTIDAYTQAIRAAGRYSTEQEKQAAATKLLNDSLVLSKLSTLDQATSIDTLSAALLQSDRELTQGAELLNKWVRVSQIANVGIDALATGVAVLGDSAETVGLSVDQLNGLIAVLSEQSISGGKEAANTAKALVGAYQSDKAEAALNKYGVALRKTNGEVRSFLEIYQELAQLRKEGVLSESAVSELSLALGGGGVRRAKDASALINSTERLNALAEESAKVTGNDSTAQDALAKKLETVQTANTRLANSFQELAEVLGNEGGLLDGMKTLVNLMTDAVKGSTELFSVLGRSGPILATVVAGLGAMNAYYSVGGRKDVALSALGAQGGGFKGFGFGLGGGPTGGQFGASTGGGPLADILRMNYRGAGIIGGAGVALQAGSNLAAGKNENALANVAGGVIGAAIGATFGPMGLAIGANIGSAAGDAMVNSLKTHKGDFESIFAPPEQRGAGNFEELKKFFSNTSVGNAPLPKTLAGLSDDEIKRLLFTAVGGGSEDTGTLKSRNFAFFQNKQYTEGGAALELLRRNNPEVAKIFEQEYARRKAEEEAKRKTEVQATSPQFVNLQNQASAARQAQLGQLAQGKITTADYGRISSQLGGFPSVALKSVNAMDENFQNISKDITSASEAYDAFLYIAQYGTQEQITQLSTYSDDILKLKEYIGRLQKGENVIDTTLELSFGDVKITSLEQLQKLLGESQSSLKTNLGVSYNLAQQQQAQKITLPPLVGDYNKPTAIEDYNKAVEDGKAIQLKYYQSVGKTDQEIQSLISGIETFYTTVTTGSDAIFKATSGLEQRFYELAKAAQEAEKGFGLQQFDVDRATLERLAQQSIALGNTWQQQTLNDSTPGNFATQQEDLLALTNDGVAKPIHADFRILALLLEKIVDQNQKQLDGQYNIPEGATFWVPLTAAYYRNKDTGSGDLQSMLDSLAVDTNTSATNENTRALQELSTGLTNTDRLKLEYPAASINKYDPYGIAQRAEPGNRGAITKYAPGGLANPMPREQPLDYNAMNANRLRNAEYPISATTQSVVDSLKNMFQGFQQGFPANKSPIQPGLPSFNGKTQATSPVTPTTKLDLKFSSNVNLMVDGRILAQTLQSYMASELLRTEQTTGVTTKRYVI